jgi:ferredoxin
MLHGYVYLKYINLYIYKMRKSLSRFLPDKDDAVHPAAEYDESIEELAQMSADWTNRMGRRLETNTYHAKVMRMSETEQIFNLKDDLNLPNLPKTIIPYEKARRVIIENPQRILLLQCACRNSRGDKGCYPREVCMLLGEPWVSWGIENIKENNPRIITQEEALEIIKAQHEAGNVQSAFFKDACGDRLYGFCNCCTCCCVALAGQNYAGAPAFADSGYIREVDAAKCKSCGNCAKYCHFLSPRIEGEKMEWDPEKCKGCGVCADKCPNGAISMKLRDPAVSAPLDLEKLIPLYTEKPE